MSDSQKAGKRGRPRSALPRDFVWPVRSSKEPERIDRMAKIHKTAPRVRSNDAVSEQIALALEIMKRARRANVASEQPATAETGNGYIVPESVFLYTGTAMTA